MQIYDAENNCTPFRLHSVINSWNSHRPETITKSDAETNETGSSTSIIAEICEEVSYQLHFGITKAARRVVLDEIISGVIAEFVSTKKVQRQLKQGSFNEAVKTCSIDQRKVTCTEATSLHLLFFFFFFLIFIYVYICIDASILHPWSFALFGSQNLLK